MKNNKYPKLVQMVVDFLMKCRAEFPDVTDDMLDNNGEITYANGNDGTGFDWGVNDHLCELGWGVADGSVWAFKCYVNKDGSVVCYCYPHGEMKPVKEIKKQLFNEGQAYRLYRMMDKTFDANGIYDTTLNKIEEWVR